MVKYTIRKKEYDYDGKLVKIEARVRRNRGWNIDTIKVIWTFSCGSITKNEIKIIEHHSYYTPIIKKLEQIEREQKELVEKEQKELTREERRLNCKCKQKCKSEFEYGLF